MVWIQKDELVFRLVRADTSVAGRTNGPRHTTPHAAREEHNVAIAIITATLLVAAALAPRFGVDSRKLDEHPW